MLPLVTSLTDGRILIRPPVSEEEPQLSLATQQIEVQIGPNQVLLRGTGVS